MPTDTARARTDAVKFALRGVAWSVGIFGLLRLSWMESHAVLPLARAQARLAVGFFGTPALPVDVTLACSGADALALCLGAVCAYPAMWRTRLAGAAGGLALILGLNTARIGTLGRASASPEWFNTLHVYVWPALIAIVVAAYVFGWMRFAAPGPRHARPTAVSSSDRGDCTQPSRRFFLFAAGFLLVFAAASPFYLDSTWVLALAAFVARAAAATLGGVGVPAYAVDNVLWTPRGGFLVTQECISTPLIPIYLAAVCASKTTARWRILGALATLPIFTALGVARLLVVALPAAVVASPLFLVHAFYQLLFGAVIVFLAALWRYGSRTAPRHALIGLAAGVLVAYLLGSSIDRLVTYPIGSPLDDPQGAIAFLPTFQVALYIALWVAAFMAAGWTRFLAGFAVLAATQTAGLLALQALILHSGLTAHVRDIRGWAVAGPLLIAAAVINVPPARR